MGIRINSITYTPELSAGSTTHLLAVKSSKVNVEIDFSMYTFIRANPNSKIEFGAVSAGFAPNTYIQAKNGQPLFIDLNEGDDIVISGAGASDGTDKIVEKISDTLIRTDRGGGYALNLSETATISVVTPMQGIRYYFGEIENAEPVNFDSKATGDAQKLVIENYPTGAQPIESMVWETPLESRIGSATIERVTTGTGTLQQRFLIKHTIYVAPFTTFDQYTNAVNGIAPPFLNGLASLKHVFKLDMATDLTNPNLLHTVTESVNLGNVGWKDERFNGGSTNYAVTSVNYFDDLSGDPIPSLEVSTADIRVEINIQNKTDTPFSDTNTKLIPVFSYIPELKNEYTNNGKTLVENFYIDQSINTLGGAASVGDNLGTDQQMIKSVTSTFVSAEEIDVVVIISMAAAAAAEIAARSTRKSFDLGVIIQDHTLTTPLADLVHLEVDTKEYFSDASDPDLFVITNKFLKHYESDVDLEGGVGITARSEDDILAYTQFTRDTNGRGADDITINSVEMSLIMKHTDLREQVLERSLIDFSQAQVVNGIQYIDTAVNRVFLMPDLDQRKQIKVKRRDDLDAAGLKYYEILYPFRFRWDYFNFLSGVDNDFFDASAPNNGQNHDWNRYDTFADWSFYYRTKINGVKNGFAIVETLDQLLPTATYLEDLDWTNEAVKSFPLVGAEITPFLQGFEDTKIEITKEYVGAGSLPAVGDVEWECKIEVFEQGSIVGMNYISSVRDTTQYSWLKGITAANLVDKSLAGSVHKATFLVDHLKLNQQNFAEGTQIKISGRIYDKVNTGLIPADAKLLEDGTVKFMEDGTVKILD